MDMLTSQEIHALNQYFPNLRAEGFTHTSPQTTAYNCIAWAANDNQRWWWPEQAQPWYYWPSNVTRDITVASFMAAFETLGYIACADGTQDNGFEKVVFYGHGNNVAHAARQLANGKWTSKLGPNVDIEHTVRGLEGGAAYGNALQYMKRPVSIPYLNSSEPAAGHASLRQT